MTVKPRKISEIRIRPACPTRLAAAMLRRAFVVPILAAPPVGAIQASLLPLSDAGRERIILNYEAKSLYKEKNYWLVLTRTLLAGFNAPIDMRPSKLTNVAQNANLAWPVIKRRQSCV